MYDIGPFGSGFDTFDTAFSLMPVLMFLFIAVFVGVIVAAAVRGAKQYKHNNDSPVLTVECAVVAKRTEVRYLHHANNDMMDSASTDYYATFQVESGDRIELEISGQEYGLLAEGDRGKLTFQGTRYKGFERAL